MGRRGMRAGLRMEASRTAGRTAGADDGVVAPATAAKCEDSAACSRVGDCAAGGVARRFGRCAGIRTARAPESGNAGSAAGEAGQIDQAGEAGEAEDRDEAGGPEESGISAASGSVFSGRVTMNATTAATRTGTR